MSQNVTEEEGIPPDRAAEVSSGQSRAGSRQGFQERVADKRMLKLIRAFLKAGVMEDGNC